MSLDTTVILLSGYLQSGKDTIGTFLCRHFGFIRYAFADVLKDEISQLYGFERSSLDTQEGKSRVIDDAKGTTVRDILITHGQQRRAENINHWIDRVLDKINAGRSHHDSRPERIVITDWRFPNEFYRIREMLAKDETRNTNVHTWRVERWDKPPLRDETELALDSFPFDVVIPNTAGLKKLDYLVKERIYTTPAMRIPVILTDVDDVLLQWVQGFKDFLLHQKGYNVRSEYPTTWNIGDWILDPSGKSLDKQTVDELVFTFNHSPEFGNLAPYRDAIDGLEFLKTETDYHVVAITSCTDDSHAIRHRRSNIMRHFSDRIDHLICLPLGADKTAILSRFAAPSLFVDDNPHNVAAGKAAGHVSVLMVRPWNSTLASQHEHAVSDWYQLKRFVQDENKFQNRISKTIDS